jgi:AAA domain
VCQIIDETRHVSIADLIFTLFFVTGKTTLLVSVICRYLLENQGKKRLMVCAPTNKAIAVLASRFMATVCDGMYGRFVQVGAVD